MSINATIQPNFLMSKATLMDVPLERIIVRPEDNYRWGSEGAMRDDLAKNQEKFQHLVSTIRTTGLMNPVGVRVLGDQYIAVFGFNRLLAAREACLETVRAYVFPADIPTEVLWSLQILENNDDLRRSVHWLRELKHCMALHAHMVEYIRSLPTDRRPRLPSGRMKCIRRAAWEKVGEMVGRSSLTLMEREMIVRRLHPKVLEHAEQHEWSYKSTLEFYSGDAKKPFPERFVLEVLQELKRCHPSLSSDHITPSVIQQAKKRVAKWLAEGRGQDGRPLWRSSEPSKPVVEDRASGTDSENDAGEDDESEPMRDLFGKVCRTGYSTGVMRDIAVNLMYQEIRRRKLSLQSSEEAWNDVLRSKSAYRISGLGIISGDVTISDDLTDFYADPEGVDLDARSNFFIEMTTVLASLKYFVSQRTVWRRWIEGMTLCDVNTGSRRSNSFLIRKAAAEAAELNLSLRGKVLYAWQALHEFGAIRG